MADPRKRSADNVPGEFFVDTTCIDCDQCREIAPQVFGDGSGKACVCRQPESGRDRMMAFQALLSCPVGAIGSATREGLAEAADSFPLRVEDNVHSCGYAAKNSFGASSYFIARPEGNVLVDSPRFAARLVRRLEALGGVRWMFLSHVDDIADHARFRAHFGCERIIHSREGSARRGPNQLREMEIVMEGDQPHLFAPDLTIVPTPGHTRGHQALLYGDRYLFTGDHLWWSPARERLSASRTYCWFSWEKQIESMRRLLDYRFDWVLPGHGHRHHAAFAQMHQELAACIDEMQRQN